MQKPELIMIDGAAVYSADELYNYDAAFFVGCPRVRTIIEKKRLNEEDYIFAYRKSEKWVKSTANYPRAKLYLMEQYVIQNVPKMMDEVNPELYKYPEAPEILELDDDEKFKDENGNVIEIEVRGERNHDSCYFKVEDVSRGFNMPNLQNIIIKENTNYKVDIHYKYFTITKKNIVLKVKSKIYLTYNGILKVLFSSRTGNAEIFQAWATEKLFAIQMGTREQKDELAAKLIGIHSETVKDVFRINSAKTPCVYLFMIGRARDLLHGEYNKDDILCKFGCSDDLPRRCDELTREFKREFSEIKIQLILFSIIDIKYKYDAEQQVKTFFQQYEANYKTNGNRETKEMIVINLRNMQQYRQFYSMLQNTYIGQYEEMTQRISILEKEIIEYQNKIAILQEKHTRELLTREKELLQEKHTHELLIREKELLQEKHKNELLEMKLYYIEKQK